MARDTEYDVYCHARDRGTEVDKAGGTPDAGNPGNDATFDHVLTTKRDIHTMGDSTSPTLVSVNPASGDINVVKQPKMTLVFNEDIQANTGDIRFESSIGLTFNLPIANANDNLCVQRYAHLTITLSTFALDFAGSGCDERLQAGELYYMSFEPGTLTDDSANKNQVAAFGAAKSYYFRIQR